MAMRVYFGVVSALSSRFATMRRGIGHAVRPYPVTGLPTGRRLDLPGRGQTFITDSGKADGPVVFLLHSVSTTGLLCWYPVIPLLERDFRVITMDHRLHGRGITSDTFTLDDCADDVVAVADALGIDSFVAAGFSMGGGIAQLTWQRHQSRVSGLVLCSTGPYFSSIEPNRLLLEQRIGRALTVVDKILPSPPDRILDDPSSHPVKWGLAQVASTPLGLQGVFAEAMANFDSRDWLGDIAAPTAVVVSTHDKIVQPERQQLLVDGIPGAQRFDVAGGHACCVIGADKFVPEFTAAVRSVIRTELAV